MIIDGTSTKGVWTAALVREATRVQCSPIVYWTILSIQTRNIALVITRVTNFAWVWVAVIINSTSTLVVWAAANTRITSIVQCSPILCCTILVIINRQTRAVALVITQVTNFTWKMRIIAIYEGEREEMVKCVSICGLKAIKQWWVKANMKWLNHRYFMLTTHQHI